MLSVLVSAGVLFGSLVSLPGPSFTSPCVSPRRGMLTRMAAERGQEIKTQAESVPLPLSRGLQLAVGDLLGKLLDVLDDQERISSKKFANRTGQADPGIVTLKRNGANWSPFREQDASLVSYRPWGAPLAALFQDDFGAVKTMALFSAIKLADGAYGQFRDIVAGTWQGMPPNIKGFIPRLLKIVAALRLLEDHYTSRSQADMIKAEILAMFDELDANEDGRVSWDEWQQYYLRRNGMNARKISVLDSVFRKLGKDGVGSTTKEEFCSQVEYTDFLRKQYVAAKGKVEVMMLRLAQLIFLLVKREATVPLKGKEAVFLEEVLPPLGIDGPFEGVNYAQLANRLDRGARGLTWADELDEGAKDFAAYFILRNSNKRDLKAFELSCYGQAVKQAMKTVLRSTKRKGKEELVLAELQALQALPY